MSAFDHSVITNVGLNALTDAEAGHLINYVHFEAGDGTITGGDAEMYGLTALKHKVMDFPITGFSNDGNGQLTLTGTLSSKTVATGFYFREVSVKCTIDGGPEILYAVANCGALADYIPPSTDVAVIIQSIQLVIRIDRAPNVTINVVEGLDVTAANIGPGTVGPGWFRDKIAGTLWFKRLVKGTLLNFTETSDTVKIDNPGADTAANIGAGTTGAGVFKVKDASQILQLRRITSPKGTIQLVEETDRITIDLWAITIDLDLYVYLGAPDVFPNFSTIQKALNYLTPFSIPSGIYANINVSAGVWNNSDTINVDHPNGSQIRIFGTQGTQKTVGTVSLVSGTTVQLNGAAGLFSEVAVGDYILYQNTGSHPGAAISGCCLVSAKAADGSWIRYDTKLKSTMPSLTGVSGGTMIPIKTVIKFSADRRGFNVRRGLGILQNVVLSGHSSGIVSTGGRDAFCVIYGEAVCSQVGLHNWVTAAAQNDICYGFVAQPGHLDCYNCGANGGTEGYTAGWAGQLTMHDCFANGNARNGLSAFGGNLLVFNSYGMGNESGLSSIDKGYTKIDQSTFRYNSQFGIYCYSNSYVGIGPIGPSQAQNNANKDIYLLSVSSIIRFSGIALGYGTSNITPNALSSDGCLFIP